MYDNTVRLIGFLGKDAEVKSTKSGNEYTVLSLATQASWKDKKSGEYVNRTEWHRMIAWANLSTFAATLKKGTHLSVEGELRYREFNDKKHKKVKVRLAEIHLGKIGKLDRAEKPYANAEYLLFCDDSRHLLREIHTTGPISLSTNPPISISRPTVAGGSFLETMFNPNQVSAILDEIRRCAALSYSYDPTTTAQDRVK